MNSDPGREEFLSDVVEEVAAPFFRADLLEQMLGEVRQSRARRRRNQRILAASSILLGLGLVVTFLPGDPSPIEQRVDPLVVHSAALEPDMMVATTGNIGFINSGASPSLLVEARPADKLFEVIGDDKLLALLGERPAVLVRHGAFGEELVFLYSADANGFQVH